MSASANPKVGFVSLGCPKALVDSERILTQLRAEGYAISPNYGDADLVVVNTCGFIDSAVEESLDAIGEALKENGKVIVTGCLGAKGDVVKKAHPQVLAVTGPHALEEVMQAVHIHLPKPHDPKRAHSAIKTSFLEDKCIMLSFESSFSLISLLLSVSITISESLNFRIFDSEFVIAF